MSERSEPITSHSIARHTVQSILHSAVQADSGACFGIVACGRDSVINHAVPLESRDSAATFAELLAGNSDLQHTVKLWRTQGILPCGAYFISDIFPPSAGELEAYEAALGNAFPELVARRLTHIVLKLNTAGCLEAFAFSLAGGKACPIPLTLLEDGQETQNR